MQVPPSVIEEDEEAAGLMADVREQQQRFVGLHRAREELRRGLKPPAALQLHVQRLRQDRSQLQRRVAQAQANLASVPDADAIKVRSMQIRTSGFSSFPGIPRGAVSSWLDLTSPGRLLELFRASPVLILLGAYKRMGRDPRTWGPLAKLHQQTASITDLEPRSGDLGATPVLYGAAPDDGNVKVKMWVGSSH